MHLSAMGGIENGSDALEYILLGAGTVQVTTAVMQYGYRIIDDLLQGLADYLRCKGIASVEQLVGAATGSVVDHQDVERDIVVLPLFGGDRCVGCGRCYLSCQDGGHQAIAFDPSERKPRLLAKRCVGCHLCRLVCPTGAIGMAKKAIHR